MSEPGKQSQPRTYLCLNGQAYGGVFPEFEGLVQSLFSIANLERPFESKKKTAQEKPYPPFPSYGTRFSTPHIGGLKEPCLSFGAACHFICITEF